MPSEGRETTLRVGDTVGAYRLVREIGRGAMAVVFEASSSGGRPMALKALLPELADRAEIVDRFEREGRILQALRHENIARVYDVGTLPNGTLYLVIELLEGEDLGRVLETSGPLPVATAVRYVLGACRGVAEAHAQGIVHRDLKPANLFLARDARGRVTVKILDFGVAKVLGGVESTRAREVIGSPQYVAPEQLVGAGGVGPQTDVWALGVVLYKALTDTVPFDGPTIAKLCTAIVEQTPRSIRAVRPDCPPALEAVVRRCLSKDPAARYATARELADALEPFAAEVVARPSVPVVDDGYDATDQDATLVRVDEGTRLMPAARALQKQSAIAVIAGTASPREGSDRRDKSPRSAKGRGRAPGRVVLIGASVLAACVLLGGGAYVATRSPWRGRSAPVVKLRVTTQPEGAFFSVDYGAQHVAPAEVSLAKDDHPHVLMVWKDGYRAETRNVAVASDTTVDVALAPTRK